MVVLIWKSVPLIIDVEFHRLMLYYIVIVSVIVIVIVLVLTLCTLAWFTGVSPSRSVTVMVMIILMRIVSLRQTRRSNMSIAELHRCCQSDKGDVVYGGRRRRIPVGMLYSLTDRNYFTGFCLLRGAVSAQVYVAQNRFRYWVKCVDVAMFGFRIEKRSYKFWSNFGINNDLAF